MPSSRDAILKAVRAAPVPAADLPAAFTQGIRYPDAQAQFHYIVGTALKQGADVCVLTQYQPEDLGVPT